MDRLESIAGAGMVMTEPVITAAGICILAPGDVALFLQRGGTSDYEGAWCFPGGSCEGNEGPQECAIRECREETGRIVDGDDLKELGVTRIPGGDQSLFTTYQVRIGNAFVPELNDEHVGHAWAPLSSPPRLLHPGVAELLKVARADAAEPETELQVARLIASGELPSPFPFAGNVFVAVRASGVGVAWRERHQEYTYRPPELWTSPEMLQRLTGLPLLLNHPQSGVVDGNELAMRAVGTTIFSFVRDGEPWVIGRLVDADAAAALMAMPFDTSPSVTFAPGSNIALEIGDGDTLLIESIPQTVDHLALLPNGRGVWGEGRGSSPGVEISG
jgi:8-oxo-dGTP pyrophosphatase MutT (NUDIX family)